MPKRMKEKNRLNNFLSLKMRLCVMRRKKQRSSDGKKGMNKKIDSKRNKQRING